MHHRVNATPEHSILESIANITARLLECCICWVGRWSTATADACVKCCSSIAQVTFDPDIVGPRTLLEAVEGLGYDATLEDDSSDKDGEHDPAASERRFWRRKVFWSVVFTVPVFLLGMVSLKAFRASTFAARG